MSASSTTDGRQRGIPGGAGLARTTPSGRQQNLLARVLGTDGNTDAAASCGDEGALRHKPTGIAMAGARVEDALSVDVTEGLPCRSPTMAMPLCAWSTQLFAHQVITWSRHLTLAIPLAIFATKLSPIQAHSAEGAPS